MCTWGKPDAMLVCDIHKYKCMYVTSGELIVSSQTI